MEAGQMVLLKMKYSPFAGTRILGILVSATGEKVRVKDCCIIHDFIHQGRDGTVNIRPTYIVNDQEAEGTWEYTLGEDTIGHRVVADNEEMLKLYDDTFQKYRAEKVGLTLPTNIRGNQPRA